MASPRLVTANVNQELSSLRARGMSLPRDGRRAAIAAADLRSTVNDSNLSQYVAETRQRNITLASQMGSANTGIRKQAAGDMLMALPKTREPLGSMISKGIPWQTAEEKERLTIRQWTRAFYATHYLVSLCVDAYCRFPIQGIEFSCKDNDLVKFHEQQFMEMLQYDTFLIDVGREFWTVGEVNTLANFNESLGVWDAEEIINPDDLQVRYSPFERDFRYKLKVPQYLKDLQNEPDTRWEYDLLRQEYPEIIQAIQKDEGLDVSSILLKRIVNKMTPWDLYGTPHMLRTFEQLMMEQSLNAAQDAVADRLYAPLILAKLGVEDIDGSGTPWIPDAAERDALRNDLNMALAADFRLLVHHFGLDIENVFGREAMPRLGEDYDRIERKLLQAWGIGEALVSGGTGAPYASSALNQEFVTQLMSSWQKWVRKHYIERAKIVAEAQGHFDYESAGGVHVPIMEEVLEIDEDGNEYIRKRPKLLIPDIKFATINLRDENVERQFLQTLKMSGVPISDQSLMVNIPIEFDEELDRVDEEKLKKSLKEARFNKKLYDLLVMQGLPIPPELQQMMAPPMVAPQVGPGSAAAPPGILPPGSTGQEDMSEQMAEDPTLGGAVPPGGSPAVGGAMPMMQSMPIADITTPPATPNLTPNMIQAPAIPGTDATEQSASTFLPKNWISQRPEISDQARGNMPRKAGSADERYIEWQDKDEKGNPVGEARLLHKRLADRRFGKQLREARMAAGPKHVGMSSHLTEESIHDAVVNRKWAEFLKVDLPDDVEVGD
ncbi:MAG TPA: hypothetical protein VIY48_03885 [Candidatus Paceibacterota bacterium]